MSVSPRVRRIWTWDGQQYKKTAIVVNVISWIIANEISLKRNKCIAPVSFGDTRTFGHKLLKIPVRQQPENDEIMFRKSKLVPETVTYASS